jgi:hypothetical protein
MDRSARGGAGLIELAVISGVPTREADSRAHPAAQSAAASATTDDVRFMG